METRSSTLIIRNSQLVLFRHHAANGDRLRLSVASPQSSARIEQRFMATLVERRIDCIGDDRGQRQRAQSVAGRIADQIADDFLVERFDEAGDERPEAARLRAGGAGFR